MSRLVTPRTIFRSLTLFAAILLIAKSSAAQEGCPRDAERREGFVRLGLYDSVFYYDSLAVDCAQRTWGKDDPRNQRYIHDLLVSASETKRKQFFLVMMDECIRLAERNPGKTDRAALKFLIMKALNIDGWGGTLSDAESLLVIIESCVPTYDFEHDPEGVLYLQQLGKLYSRVPRNVDFMIGFNARAMSLADRQIAQGERILFYGDYRHDDAKHARLLEQLATQYYTYHEDYVAVAQMLRMSIVQYLPSSPIDSASLMQWHSSRPSTRQFLNTPHSDAVENDTLFVQRLQLFAEELDHSKNVGDSGRHLECIGAISRLANLYQEFGRYADAESLHRIVLKLRVKLLGDDSPAAAASYNNIANSLLGRERFTEAKEMYQEGIRRLSALSGPTSDIVIRMTGNLADAEYEIGNVAETERLLVWYLEQRRGSSNRSLEGMALHKLGEFYLSQGRLDEAEALLREAILIKDSISDLQPFTIAESHRSLADVLIQRQRLLEAEPVLQHALYLQKKATGNSHPTLVKSLLALGDLHLSLRRFQEALTSYQEASEIVREYVGDTSLAYGEAKLKSARAHLLSGNPFQATKILDSCLSIADRYVQDRSRVRLVDLLMLRAAIFRAQGSISAALDDLDHAENIIESQLGRDHPSMTLLCLERARTLTREGEEKHHDSCLTVGMKLARENFGDTHPLIAEYLEEQSTQMWRNSRYPEMIDAAQQALRIRIENVLSNAGGLVEQDAVGFAQQINRARDLLLTGLRLSESSGDISPEAATALLNTKGLVLDIDMQRRATFVGDQDSSQVRLVRAIQSDQYHISRLLSPSMMTTSLAPLTRRQLDSLRQHIASLLPNIAVSQKETFASSGRIVACTDIQDLLGTSDCAVEYIKYHDLGRAGKVGFDAYAGIQIRPDAAPQIFSMGESVSLDRLIVEQSDQLRIVIRAVGLPDSEAKRSFLARSYPLTRKLFPPDWTGTRFPSRVFISPDAAIYAVSFAGLPISDSAYLIERTHIQNCSHLRGLVDSPEQTKIKPSILALGGPDYENGTPQPYASGSHEFSGERNGERANFVLRSAAENCGLFSQPFQPLAHAVREVEKIGELWRSLTDGMTKIKSGIHASEAFVKENGGKFSVLHFATHGFVLDSSCLSRQSRRELSSIGLGQLFRSGLCLSGANVALHKARVKMTEDGLLTAYEIALLDLRDVSLVMLSACETGRGETEPGQGMYGMRRAFELAGAGSIISSLWEIDDRRTVKQVSSFYQAFLQHEDVSEALRLAQLAEVKRIRANKQIDHPALWAAFVLHSNDINTVADSLR